jgi:hypothetical protein
MEFILSPEELKRIKEWDDSHKCKITNKYVGAVGGRLTYSFTPTGMGMITIVKCACGKKLDLTDCSSW